MLTYRLKAPRSFRGQPRRTPKMIPPHLTRAQQVTTAESSRTTVRPPGAGLLSWILRMLSAPGAELVLPVVAPRPVVNVGNTLGSWLTSAGIHSPRAGELWNAYSSLSDGQTRQAFLRTLRSVVDYRGQAVSAINKLHVSSGLPILLIWGDQDRVIPVAHGYATHAAVPGSRLEVLPGVGHFPHVESPTAVVEILDDFIATTGPSADLTNRKS